MRSLSEAEHFPVAVEDSFFLNFLKRIAHKEQGECSRYTDL